jgi:hypothetical protein
VCQSDYVKKERDNTMVRILLDRSRDCNINSIQRFFLFSYGGVMLNQVRWISVAAFLLLFILSLANNAAAQVDRGSIVGTVTDASAASVAAAKVTVTNLETNQATTPFYPIPTGRLNLP